MPRTNGALLNTTEELEKTVSEESKKNGYSCEELVTNAQKLFNQPPFAVKAVFRFNKKLPTDRLTIEESKVMITDFMTKKV
jgi:hypothetical protein